MSAPFGAQRGWKSPPPPGPGCVICFRAWPFSWIVKSANTPPTSLPKTSLLPRGEGAGANALPPVSSCCLSLPSAFMIHAPQGHPNEPLGSLCHTIRPSEVQAG